MGSNIKTVGVCGAAGTMGAGIALVAARAGFKTIAYDLSVDALTKARGQSAAFLGKSVERGKMKPEERDAVMTALSTTTDIAALEIGRAHV